MTEQKRRLLLAVAMVAVLVGLVPLSGLVASIGKPAQLAIRDLTAAWKTDVSEDYANELFDTKGFADVRVNGDQSVVGFSSDLKAEEMLSHISSTLEGKGWRSVPSGSSVLSSFEKKEGKYAWALVSCTQMSSGCSVVIQSLTSDQAN